MAPCPPRPAWQLALLPAAWGVSAGMRLSAAQEDSGGSDGVPGWKQRHLWADLSHRFRRSCGRLFLRLLLLVVLRGPSGAVPDLRTPAFSSHRTFQRSE